MPGEELIDPLLLEFRILRISGHTTQGIDAGFPSPKVGFDTIAEVAACKFAEAGLRGEVIFPRVRDRNKNHGPEGTEEAQSLTDGALA